MESLYFLLPLFFVLLILMPINFKIKTTLNADKKMIYLSIFLWKFKLVLFKIFLNDKKVILYKKKKKKEIEISLSVKQIYFVEQLSNNLKSKTQIHKISFYGKIGLSDAFNTALYCALAISIIETILCYFKNRKPTCSMQNMIMPSYNKKILLFTLYTSVSITLFDLFYSILISLFSLRSKKYAKHVRKSKIS